MVMDCTLDMRRSDVCWVRRMEDSRVCVRVSVIILLIVFGMLLTSFRGGQYNLQNIGTITLESIDLEVD